VKPLSHSLRRQGGGTAIPSQTAPQVQPSAKERLTTAAHHAEEKLEQTLGQLVHLDAFDDSYENHEPKPLKLGEKAGQLLDKIAPIRTHERVIHDIGGSFFGISVGVTVSQLDLVRKNTHGVELIHVVNPDGSSNIETVLGRLPLSHNHRIELQAPALNTSLTPGELPLGARFVGVGLTTDVASAMDHDALSYTAEVKLTERSILEFAILGGAGAADIAADALTNIAGAGVAAVVSDTILGAVPILSAGLAVASARRAWHVLHDPTASTEMKAFAVAHTLGDTVRVFAPLAGTLINASLVGVAALCGWVHMRHAKHAPPAGPPYTRDPDPPIAPP